MEPAPHPCVCKPSLTEVFPAGQPGVRGCHRLVAGRPRGSRVHLLCIQMGELRAQAWPKAPRPPGARLPLGTFPSGPSSLTSHPSPRCLFQTVIPQRRPVGGGVHTGPCSQSIGERACSGWVGHSPPGPGRLHTPPPPGVESSPKPRWEPEEFVPSQPV